MAFRGGYALYQRHAKKGRLVSAQLVSKPFRPELDGIAGNEAQWGGYLRRGVVHIQFYAGLTGTGVLQETA